MVASKTPITAAHRPGCMVMVIGGPDALVRAVRTVAYTLTGAGVAVASVPDSAAVAAEYRPFAIVVSAELYMLDPSEFRDLARDVGARLLCFDTKGLSVDSVADTVSPLLEAAAKTHGTS